VPPPAHVHIVNWKLLMRAVTMEVSTANWESLLGKQGERVWDPAQKHEELKKVNFPKSILPWEGVIKEIMLAVFRDYLRDLCCSLVYMR
jgi:hypothetical protein